MDNNGIIRAEDITRLVLPNGIVVLVRTNHNSPSVSLRGLIKAGSMYDTDDKAGLASFTAGTLERGTERFSYQEINKILDGMGATLGVGAGDESAGFYARCLSEDLDTLLDILSEVLMHPTFPRSEVEKVRGEILTGLREAKNDTQWVADYEFHRTAYPKGHPFHRPVEGSEETVAAISRSDLVRFHTTYYRPDATIIAVVGDITPEQAADKLDRAFASWKASGPAHPYVIEDVRNSVIAQRKNVFVPGKTQADIVMGFPGLARTSEDYHPANVANMILGVLGMYGRLGENVREQQGLAYYVTSQIRAGIGAGPWIVRAGVNPSNIDRAIASIETELRRLRDEPVSADELAEAQDYLTGSLALRLETNDGVAGTLLGMELYALGLDYLERYNAIIRGLTVESLLTVSRRYIDLDHNVIVVAGPVQS